MNWIDRAVARRLPRAIERDSKPITFCRLPYRAFLLVGSKIVLALVAGRSREILKGQMYRVVMLTLGLMLVVFAVLLLCDGVRRFQ